MHKGCGSAIDNSLLGITQINTHISTLWVLDESGIACVIDTTAESDAVPWHIWTMWQRLPVLAMDQNRVHSSSAFM